MTALVLALVLAVAAAAVALAILQTERSTREREVERLRADLAKRDERLTALEVQAAAVAKRLSSAESGLKQSKQGVAPLANRVLRSVFTVDSGDGLGTAWAAWSGNGFTYLITARHVVANALDYGVRDVKVRRQSKTWRGRITNADRVNDLAVVRVKGEVAPPLWQTPDESISPIPGDELLLIGSPYGLEGTVTTGIVSRVTYDAIQTDAAANPGNSGGPAVDADGNVVGILIWGGGQNLNFAVPIQRVCVTLRRC